MKQTGFGSFLLLLVLTLLGQSCLKTEVPENENAARYASFWPVMLPNNDTLYDTGDTLWFEVPVADSLTDAYTGEQVKLENATFDFSATVYLLYTTNDSLTFLEKNFDVFVDEGFFLLANVFNEGEAAYSFDFRFGLPLSSERLRFGLVPHFDGIFSMEATGAAFFGPERSNYNDFSQNNPSAQLTYYFDVNNVNYPVYKQIPVGYRLNYDYYFTDYLVSRQRFYFFKTRG
ncbi:MAG: hypothetical protein CVU09_12340 [Bacteroidetes bacterium HGW-Bacteroidetes-4]|nr:MAG: hypothetical protein CVU09_12340 [Bacteroidetes bacterium HGW-Bacteroidetes-4]